MINPTWLLCPERNQIFNIGAVEFLKTFDAAGAVLLFMQMLRGSLYGEITPSDDIITSVWAMLEC